MWIFDQTPWTDVDQNLTIHTLLLTGHDMGTALTKLSRANAVAIINPNREDVKWAKYKNKQSGI